jgi:hypothetical protein
VKRQAPTALTLFLDRKTGSEGPGDKVQISTFLRGNKTLLVSSNPARSRAPRWCSCGHSVDPMVAFHES